MKAALPKLQASPPKLQISFRFRWIYVYSLLISYSVLAFGATNPTLSSVANKFADVNQVDLQPATNSESANLLGHTSWIYAVAVSPDSNTLISGGFDKSLRFWSLKRAVRAIQTESTGGFSIERSHSVFEGSIRDAHSTAVSGIAMHPNLPIFATAGWDRRIKIWNAQTKQLLHTIEAAHADDIEAIAFTPDGSALISASLDKTIHVWNVNTRQLLQTFTSATPVYALAITPDSRMLIAGNGSGQVIVWDLQTGNLRTSLAAHRSAITALAISPDGKTLASAATDRAVRLWRLEDNSLKAELSIGTVPQALAFSPIDRVLACGNADGTVEVRQSDHGRLLKTLTNHNGSIWTVAFSSNGQALVAGGQDRKINIWLTQSLQPN